MIPTAEEGWLQHPTGDTSAPDPKLAEAARRVSALGDVLVDALGATERDDEVEFCRDLARALTDPAYRNQRLTDEAFARAAEAILGEVEPR